MTRIDSDELRILLTHLFTKQDIEPGDAAIAADVLIRADLRGVESHGINNLEMYLEPLRKGSIVARAPLEALRETPVSATLDAHGGLGIIQAVKAMNLCLDKAARSGMAMVTVRRSHHFGMAAYYAMMALERDFIGISLTNNAGVAVLPTFGAQPMFSSNPICFGAPSTREPHFVMDFATTVSSMSKLYRMVDEGDTRKVPFGLALNDKAQPTDDPVEAVKARKHLPLGSSPEMSSHKGYGLAVMVDILTGVLSGGIYGNLAERNPPDDPVLKSSSSHFFAAINPEIFRPVDDFKRDMDDMLQALRDSEKLPGAERIFTHGEKEFETEKDRLKNGIPYNAFMIKKLKTVAEISGIDWPIETG